MSHRISLADKQFRLRYDGHGQNGRRAPRPSPSNRALCQSRWQQACKQPVGRTTGRLVRRRRLARALYPDQLKCPRSKRGGFSSSFPEPSPRKPPSPDGCRCGSPQSLVDLVDGPVRILGRPGKPFDLSPVQPGKSPAFQFAAGGTASNVAARTCLRVHKRRRLGLSVEFDRYGSPC